MVSPKTLRDSGQEEMNAQTFSRAQQQTPLPISGKKRQHSASPPPETNSRRRARSTDRSSTFTSPTLNCRPENNWSCPSCGRRCWLCGLPTTASLEQLELRDEADLERARMASEPAPSSTDTSNSKNSAPSSTDTSNGRNSSKKRKKDHYTELGIKHVGPRDQKFKDCILDPLGVCWAKRSRSKGKPPLFLSSQSLPLSRVIIESDDKNLERITTDFMECKVRQYSEYSFTLLCCDSIILRDGWVENAFADKNDQELIVASVRRDKWRPQKQGPAMLGSRFVYDWDLEPDATYAVSINMFNPEYRRQLHSDAFQSWVAEKDVSVCPYLTIEYKNTDKGGKEAQAANQTIAAAILWLYQRIDLRKTVGQAFDDLSHFMITLVDSIYVISEARPEGDEYLIRRHLTGDLTCIDDLKLYIEWSNAIHAWGLDANASSFKKDIETLVNLRSAQTPSNLPTPAGTGSPTGPHSKRSGLSEQITLHEKEERNPKAPKGTN